MGHIYINKNKQKKSLLLVEAHQAQVNSHTHVERLVRASNCLLL